MKTSRTHGLIVFLLSVISSYSIIASISDDEDEFGIFVSDQSANGSSFYKSFDVQEGSLLCFLLLEFDIFLGESGEE
jgi:hypothetical protein